MTGIAIRSEKLGKLYRLGEIGTGTLSHDLNRWWAKKRGKEDPNRTVGENDVQEDWVWALKDVDFEVKQGEVLGIIGRNGAGKSTLLKILSKITSPTKGKISINGRIASLLEVGTGFHPELTGRENIFLNGAILGMSREETRKKFDAIVDFAGVEKYIDTPVKRYSSGMYVRLAFAVAAHLEPEILVIDEVLAVGDAAFQQKCLGKMNEVSQKDGRTVLFVSHQMGMIAQLCKNSIWLDAGTVKFIGPTQEAIDNYLSGAGSRDLVFNAKARSGNYVHRVEVCGIDKQVRQHFTTDEEIFFRIGLCVSDWLPHLELSINVIDRNKKFIFTINEKLEQFVSDRRNQFNILVGIPSNFLTPKQYSLNVALQVPGQPLIDYVTDICPFNIADAGTRYAMYEGFDYGSVFPTYTIVLST